MARFPFWLLQSDIVWHCLCTQRKGSSSKWHFRGLRAKVRGKHRTPGLSEGHATESRTFDSWAARTWLWAMTRTRRASLQPCKQIQQTSLPSGNPTTDWIISCQWNVLPAVPMLYARWKCKEEDKTKLAPIIKVVTCGVHQRGKVKYILTAVVKDFRVSIKANKLQKNLSQCMANASLMFSSLVTLEKYVFIEDATRHSCPSCLFECRSVCCSGKSARTGWALPMGCKQICVLIHLFLQLRKHLPEVFFFF